MEPLSSSLIRYKKPIFIDTGIKTSTPRAVPNGWRFGASYPPMNFPVDDKETLFSLPSMQAAKNLPPVPQERVRFGDVGAILASRGADPELKKMAFQTASDAAMGVSSMGAGKAGNYAKGFAKQQGIKVFGGLKGLSTKLLEKFKGMPENITQQQYNEAYNRAIKEGIRKPDIEAVQSSLAKNETGMINLPATASKVQEKLVPLKATPVRSPRWSNIGEDFIGDGKYGEIVYQSPIKTSAGDVHYREKISARGWGPNNEPGPIPKDQSFPNYFSHVRYEDMADGKTRKILETQSDLFQKENFEREVRVIGANDSKTYSLKSPTQEQFLEGAERQSPGISKLQSYNSNDPLAHLRTFREEVKRAAKDGKDTILIPSGETAMKIEGLGEQNTFRIDRTGEVARNTSQLKVGEQITDAYASQEWIITDVLGDGKFKAVPKEQIINTPTTRVGGATEYLDEGRYYLRSAEETFDISGRVDPKHFVYKLNEEAIPKEARRMGLQVEKFKDFNHPGGWWKIKIPKERAKLPVEAFGFAPFMLNHDDEKKKGQIRYRTPIFTKTKESINPFDLSYRATYERIPEQKPPEKEKNLPQKHNNPGNQVFVGQEGAERGSPKKGGGYWAKYPSEKEGFDSFSRDIDIKLKRNPGMTLRELIEIRSPGDENDLKTLMYNVLDELWDLRKNGKILGLNKSTRVSEIPRDRLLKAIAKAEGYYAPAR